MAAVSEHQQLLYSCAQAFVLPQPAGGSALALALARPGLRRGPAVANVHCIGVDLINPFAYGVGYTRLGCPLRSVESSTQLLLVLRPDLAWS
jgi:hypothetical protein